MEPVERGGSLVPDTIAQRMPLADYAGRLNEIDTSNYQRITIDALDREAYKPEFAGSVTPGYSLVFRPRSESPPQHRLFNIPPETICTSTTGTGSVCASDSRDEVVGDAAENKGLVENGPRGAKTGAIGSQWNLIGLSRETQIHRRQ